MQGKQHCAGGFDTEAEAADAAWKLRATLDGRQPIPAPPSLVPYHQWAQIQQRLTVNGSEAGHGTAEEPIAGDGCVADLEGVGHLNRYQIHAD